MIKKLEKGDFAHRRRNRLEDYFPTFRRHRMNKIMHSFPDGKIRYWFNPKQNHLFCLFCIITIKKKKNTTIIDPPKTLTPLTPPKTYSDGTVFYYKHNLFRHREDGPAVIHADGKEEYWVKGSPHRINAPAIIKANGKTLYYENGQLHRENGPAIIKANGKVKYYMNDKRYYPHKQ